MPISSRTRDCTNDPSNFCYICGRLSFVAKAKHQNVTRLVENVCYAYIGIKLGDEGKAWAIHKVCRCCV